MMQHWASVLCSACVDVIGVMAPTYHKREAGLLAWLTVGVMALRCIWHANPLKDLEKQFHLHPHGRKDTCAHSATAGLCTRDGYYFGFYFPKCILQEKKIGAATNSSPLRIHHDHHEVAVQVY